MSFAVTSLGSSADSADRSAYTCALFREPGDLALALVAVNVADVGGTAVEPTGVEGSGLVFSQVTSSVTFDTISVGTHNLSVWRSMGINLTNSVVTVTLSNPAQGCTILVHEVSGVSASGTSGANAVGKSATSVVNGNSAITALAPSATSTANAWLAFQGTASVSGIGTPGLNWSSIDSANFTSGGPITAIISAWTTLSTGTQAVWAGTSTNRAAIVLELVLDNPAIPGLAVSYVQQARSPDRLPPVPITIQGDIAAYLKRVVNILNGEAYISKFSGANPNTSGVTGVPGNLLVNVGSASTWTRLWVKGGSTMSISTTGWQMMRTA